MGHSKNEVKVMQDIILHLQCVGRFPQPVQALCFVFVFLATLGNFFLRGILCWAKFSHALVSTALWSPSKALTIKKKEEDLSSRRDLLVYKILSSFNHCNLLFYNPQF